MPSTTCVFIVLLCGVCSGMPCHVYKRHPATYNIGTKCISIGLHLSLPSLMYMNPPFLILKVRHPAVIGAYCIVGVVVVMISNVYALLAYCASFKLLYARNKIDVSYLKTSQVNLYRSSN